MRPRQINAGVLLGGAVRQSAVAALADGRSSGGLLSPQQIVTSMRIGKLPREAFLELIDGDSPSTPDPEAG
ncbi:MAG: hypothetical protein ABSG56_30740 [Bryobacteraceae bacterium]